MTEATFTLAGAARACGRSRNTVAAHIEQLIEHGAHKTEQGWSIPISSLIATGLMPRSTPPTEQVLSRSTEQVEQAIEHPQLSRVAQLEQELKTTREQLARADTDKRLAEALAAERLANLNDLRTAIRMIESSPKKPPTPLQSSEPQHRKRWWQRRRA